MTQHRDSFIAPSHQPLSRILGQHCAFRSVAVRAHSRSGATTGADQRAGESAGHGAGCNARRV